MTAAAVPSATPGRLNPVDDGVFGRLEPIWAVLLTLLYVAIYCALFYPPLMRMIDDVRLADTGMLAKESHCWIFSYQGTRTSTWRVEVTYVAQDGRSYSPDVDNFLWWRRPDQSHECTVRYDPAAPDHVSTDWGTSRLFARSLSFLIMAPLPFLFGLLLITGVLQSLRNAVLNARASSTQHANYALGTHSSATRIPSGYCRHLIRTRNRRLFVVGALLLLAASPMYTARLRAYWRGFIFGPRAVQGQDFTAPGFLPDRAGLLGVIVDHATDTGVKIYHTYADGKRFTDGHYLLATVNDYPLIIHVERREPVTSYQGTLKPINSQLKSELARTGYGVRPDANAGYFLETIGESSMTEYRSEGKVWCLLFAPMIGFGLAAVWLALRRTVDVRRHPFARLLARHGGLTDVVGQMDSDMTTDPWRREKLAIGATWLLLEKYWVPVPMPISQVVWLYRRPMKTHVRCHIHDSAGNEMEVILAKTVADEVIEVIGRRVPNAIRGYDSQLNDLWQSTQDHKHFPDAVRERFPQR